MAEQSIVLVGNASDGTIASFRLGDQALVPLAVSRVGSGCSAFAVDAVRGLVYCATKEPCPAVVTLRLDRATGALTETARAAIDDPLASLALARDGGLLLGASYHGGWGAVWPVTDGRLRAATARVEHDALHCVLTTAAGDAAYFVSLGEDLIVQCALAADGTLVPLDPPSVAAPKGSGARHLVLAGDERSAYLMTEFTGQAIRYLRDEAGTLTGVEAVDAFDPHAGLKVSRRGADPRAEGLIWGADLHLARDGAWLLCSERAASTIVAVPLGRGGSLGTQVVVSPAEQQPRGFAVTPDGRGVVVAGEASGQVSYAGVNDDGTLVLKGRYASGAGANWVRFA
ncbi:MAG: beta-propeller fold lactonase family protein [Nigerium sp.]|nr:beta-propeller fold lactonase family protein [Nigerium sp.]